MDNTQRAKLEQDWILSSDNTPAELDAWQRLYAYLYPRVTA